MARATALSVRSDPPDVVRGWIRRRFMVRHCFLTGTGRAGLTLLLRAMRRLAAPNRDEVIVPSYTCFSVAASVVKAGLRPRIVDVLPETLDFDRGLLERASHARTLAIVATNLYGLPNDLPTIAGIARNAGVFLIDDAAQAMGATVGSLPSGTWGDAGLFSLDKGKNVSAIDGGIVVTNSDAVAWAMAEEMAGLRGPAALARVLGVAKAAAYAVFLHPGLYGLPSRIPQLGLGTTVFRTDFPLELPSRFLTGLAATMLPRLPEFAESRARNAADLMNRLSAVSGVRPVSALPHASPAYLRLPLMFASEDARRAVHASLVATGIGSSPSYPSSIAEIPQLRSVLANPDDVAAGGRYVARHILTLPTHAYVRNSDIERMVSVVERRLGSMSSTAPRADGQTQWVRP